jgi:hypothetical protein
MDQMEWVSDEQRRITFTPQREKIRPDHSIFSQKTFGVYNMLLAIDTSPCSVGIAIFDGSTILGETTWVSTNRHTTILAKAVKKIV